MAAGTAYSNHGINMIPFYIFYSMFGFQRIGDFAWAAGDIRTRGFLMGGTSGRTTLAGEGLQHDDGHSHILASVIPNCVAYDPTFAYELAVIIRHGIYRMYEKQESVFYYLSIGNENYSMPPIPEGVKDGIINEFLHNRYTAAEFGLASNGASRSSGFDREPIIRMSNTFVEPGDHTLDELVKQVKLGIYFKTFTEWNIDDKRLNQRYVALEAYLIEHGEMKGLVKAPVLEITTPRLWGSVKARSRTLEFEAATCGKGDPQQGAPVWTGGPDTLLGGIRLGSR